MKDSKPTRRAFIKVRFTDAEKAEAMDRAAAFDMTLSDFIRQRTLDFRLRQSPLEKERNRLLAHIASSMNQIARWANTYKAGMDAVRVIAALADTRDALKADTPPAPCASDEVQPC